MRKNNLKYALIAAVLVLVTFVFTVLTAWRAGDAVTDYKGRLKVTAADGRIAAGDLPELPPVFVDEGGDYHLYADIRDEEGGIYAGLDAYVNGDASVLAFEKGRNLFELTSPKAALKEGDTIRFDLSFKPDEGESLNDGVHNITYRVKVIREKVFLDTDTIVYAVGALLVAVICFLIFLTGDKRWDRSFDEMQIKYRGRAAMNAFFTSVLISSGYMLCFMFDVIPFDGTTLGVVTIFPALGVFTVYADSHDAYNGFKDNAPRKELLPLFLVVGIITMTMLIAQLASGIVNSEKALEAPRLMAMSSYFLMVGIEMLIKSRSDKKEAALEAEDEES